MRRFWFVYVLMLMVGFLDASADSTRVNLKNAMKDTSANTSAYMVIIDSVEISESNSVKDSINKKYKSDRYDYKIFDTTFSDQSHYNKIKKRVIPEYWQLYVLLGIVMYYAFIRNVFHKSLPVIFQAYWNDRSINQFTRDDNFFKARNALFYFVLFVFVYATIAYYVLEYYNIKFKYSGFERYQYILMLVGVFYIFKYILLKILGYLFGVHKIVSGYLAILSVSNLVYSIIIIPFIVFYNYLTVPVSAYVMVLILSLFAFNTAYKYLRTATILRNNFQFPIFYLILYLCTFEIMPLLILYKIFLA